MTDRLHFSLSLSVMRRSKRLRLESGSPLGGHCRSAGRRGYISARGCSWHMFHINRGGFRSRRDQKCQRKHLPSGWGTHDFVSIFSLIPKSSSSLWQSTRGLYINSNAGVPSSLIGTGLQSRRWAAGGQLVMLHLLLPRARRCLLLAMPPEPPPWHPQFHP